MPAARHQKCDKCLPVCNRCETKGLECKPVQKKAVFLHGSTTNFDTTFTQGQIWVNSKPKTWRRPKHPSNALGRQDNPKNRLRSSREPTNGRSPIASVSRAHFPTPSPPFMETPPREASAGSEEISTSRFCGFYPDNNQQEASWQRHHSVTSSYPVLSSRSHETAQLPIGGSEHFYTDPGTYTSLQYCESETDIDYSVSPSSVSMIAASHHSVQESCLMRCFIEELSPLVRSPVWMKVFFFLHG